MSEFADQLHDVFERFGAVSLRRMFGGHGLYHEGRMFGLVSGDRLYLKTDEQSVAEFTARELQPFSFERRGKTMRTSYFEAPPDVFEDRDEAAAWARRAWAAVLRTPPPKKKTAQRKPKSRER